MIYAGACHFTVRFVDPEGRVWFNDGIENRRALIDEGMFEPSDQWNKVVRGAIVRDACMLVYARH